MYVSNDINNKENGRKSERPVKIYQSAKVEISKLESRSWNLEAEIISKPN